MKKISITLPTSIKDVRKMIAPEQKYSISLENEGSVNISFEEVQKILAKSGIILDKFESKDA